MLTDLGEIQFFTDFIDFSDMPYYHFGWQRRATAPEQK